MTLAKPNSSIYLQTHSTGLGLNLLFWLRLGTLSLSQLETVATQHNLKARLGAGLQNTGCSEQGDVRTSANNPFPDGSTESAIESQKIEVRAEVLDLKDHKITAIPKEAFVFVRFDRISLSLSLSKEFMCL